MSETFIAGVLNTVEKVLLLKFTFTKSWMFPPSDFILFEFLLTNDFLE